MRDDRVTMKFDLNTLEHLGIKLYAKLPPVLSEFISNAWDADATKVDIEISDLDTTNKTITIRDNGHGLSIDEISDTFLRIGRNRRGITSLSKGFNRSVIGKKGVGKLSGFGIANIMKIKTIKDGDLLSVTLDINEIKESSSDSTYKPDYKIEKTKEDNGTQIELLSIKRKTAFDLKNIKRNISNTFSIIKNSENPKENFNVRIKYNDSEFESLTSLSKFHLQSYEFQWKFPEDYPEDPKFQYGIDNNITGILFTADKPIKRGDSPGIMLLSLGKSVNETGFFDLRANDNFHSYATGYLNIDYIENIDDDIISTDRKSLLWTIDEAEKLRDFLGHVLSYTNSNWKDKRAEKAKQEILEKHNIDVGTWALGLDKTDQPLANKILKSVLTSNLDTSIVAEISGYVKDMFHLKSFRTFLEDLDDVFEGEEETTKIVEMFKKWELVEATELANLAKIRLQAIDQFEKHIDGDAREVPTLHSFLKQFPWILDPKIIEFKDEIRYSQILKDSFPDEDLDEPDRRLDFLCNSTGKTLHVIEIKRPSIKVGLKEINQLKDYLAFVEDTIIKTSGNFDNVVGYIISNDVKTDTRVQRELDNGKGYYYFRSYDDMLRESKAYHQEFIDKKNEMETNL